MASGKPSSRTCLKMLVKALAVTWDARPKSEMRGFLAMIERQQLRNGANIQNTKSARVPRGPHVLWPCQVPAGVELQNRDLPSDALKGVLGVDLGRRSFVRYVKTIRWDLSGAASGIRIGLRGLFFRAN